MTTSFDWSSALSVDAPAGLRPQHRLHVASRSPRRPGLRMLWQGGNAVDAAIAAAAVMTIVEPCSNGLGSDAFCILWDGTRAARPERVRAGAGCMDAGVLPAQVRRDARTPPVRGWDSVSVPGAVAGWVALSERFGKLPFADLLEPAIEVAERGYAVPGGVQEKWVAATPLLRDAARLRRGLPAARTRPARRRALRLSRRRESPAGDRRDARRRALRRRDRRRPRPPMRAPTAAPSTSPTSPPTRPNGSIRSASTTPATACTRSRRTGRASPR